MGLRRGFPLHPAVALLFAFCHPWPTAGGKPQLRPDFYDSTCPRAASIVAAGVMAAIRKEGRNGASMLRLHFHDCFVNGCDGSVLLQDTGGFTGEQTARPNNRSLRALDVVDAIKTELEKSCPRVVSCADLLALAARDSVVHLGGPSWRVALGRRDSTSASVSAANTFIPAPSFNLTALPRSFAAQGLSFKDMVALSGGHTVGLARCTSFRPHIYNDSNIDAAFAGALRRECPARGRDDVHQRLDFRTSTRFDNFYFKNLLDMKGLLHSDQVLHDATSADSLVNKYAGDQGAFFRDFAEGMVRMGSIKPLTGSKGQIRTHCGRVNS